MNEQRNIVLTGPPGSGKSTIGRLLADLLGRKFIDMDRELERDFGCSIETFFKEQGEAAFRDAETILCSSLEEQLSLVIASGGGVLTRVINKEMLQKNGILVNLRASLATLQERLNHGETRPLLGDHLVDNLRTLLERRQPLYDAVPIQIDTDGRTDQEIVRQIADLLERIDDGLI